MTCRTPGCREQATTKDMHGTPWCAPHAERYEVWALELAKRGKFKKTFSPNKKP